MHTHMSEYGYKVSVIYVKTLTINQNINREEGSVCAVKLGRVLLSGGRWSLRGGRQNGRGKWMV